VVAVVGCGRWGRNVVRDLVGLDCDVVAIDPSHDARADAIGLGAFAAFASMSEYPNDDVLHGVVVAGPTREHARLAQMALGRGIPVFVEKPLTDDVASATSLVELGGDLLFVMHKWHYHPGIEALAAFASGGRLGRVHGVTSERAGEANWSDDTDALWLLGPHEVTIGARILGSFPERVEAVADVVTGRLSGVDTIARWADGRWHRWSISTRPEPHRRRVIVHGTHGHAILPDAYAEHVELSLSPDGVTTHRELVRIAQDQPLARELRSFRDHLLGGPPPPTPGLHGLAVIRLLADVRESAGLPPWSIGVLRPPDPAEGYDPTV
jgi:predicted dehydrogenase